MRQFIGVAICTVWVASVGVLPGYAQTGGSSGGFSPGASLESMFAFGPSATSSAPCGAVTGSNPSAGLPCSFSNGQAIGTQLNSGLLSTQVPAGGAVRLDLTGIKQSWGGAFARGWNWTFYQALPVVLVVFGLVFGMRFLMIWIVTWGDKK